MAETDYEDTESSPNVTRRRLLATGTGAVVGVTALGAVTGTAAAWQRLDADFRGCSEVWIVVGENDFDYDPNLQVDVIVAAGGEAVCRTVDITRENATTIPGQYGDNPIVKYSVSGGEKILGVVGRTPSGYLFPCQVHVNDHPCTQTPNTPSVEDADCYRDPADCGE